MIRGLLAFVLISLAACLGLFGFANAVDAQQATAARYIGVVAPFFSVDSEEGQAFREGLRTAGYIEGRNLSIDWWFGHGSYNGVTDAVAKVVRSKADVIVVESTVAALAAKRATQTIPIVMAFVGDPVGVGLVESLGRPGGNITGLTNMTGELGIKRLQLLKEAVPSARRVGVLWNPETPFHSVALAHLTSVAPELHIELIPIAVQKVEQLGPAFSALTRSKADAVLVLDDPFIVSNGTAIVEFATKARLPVASGPKELANQGVLISYTTQSTERFRRAAAYVAKILKGAKPSDLPIEQPTQFKLYVNLKTARALGLKIPESILLRADEVIR